MNILAVWVEATSVPWPSTTVSWIPSAQLRENKVCIQRLISWRGAWGQGNSKEILGSSPGTVEKVSKTWVVDLMPSRLTVSWSVLLFGPEAIQSACCFLFVNTRAIMDQLYQEHQEDLFLYSTYIPFFAYYKERGVPSLTPTYFPSSGPALSVWGCLPGPLARGSWEIQASCAFLPLVWSPFLLHLFLCANLCHIQWLL